jgi:hypothetical protein
MAQRQKELLSYKEASSQIRSLEQQTSRLLSLALAHLLSPFLLLIPANIASNRV